MDDVDARDDDILGIDVIESHRARAGVRSDCRSGSRGRNSHVSVIFRSGVSARTGEGGLLNRGQVLEVASKFTHP